MANESTVRSRNENTPLSALEPGPALPDRTVAHLDITNNFLYSSFSSSSSSSSSSSNVTILANSAVSSSLNFLSGGYSNLYEAAWTRRDYTATLGWGLAAATMYGSNFLTGGNASAFGNIGRRVVTEISEAVVAKGIATPYGLATQGGKVAAIAARTEVDGGATLYRIGTTGKSQAAEAQFWSLEHPLTVNYASKYGIPAENVLNANFIEAATLRPGTPFVTRTAPGVGANIGGGIEVVVPSGGVQMKWFTGTP